MSFERGWVGGAGPGRDAEGRCPYRDGPRRAAGRAGGLNSRSWGTTEAGNGQFTLLRPVRESSALGRTPPKAPKAKRLCLGRGGQGVEPWVRAATEAGRQRFILPGPR